MLTFVPGLVVPQLPSNIVVRSETKNQRLKPSMPRAVAGGDKSGDKPCDRPV